MVGRRSFQPVALSAIVLLLASPVLAQMPPNGKPQRAARPANQRWQQMSPGDRQRLRTNVERWRQLPDAKRRDLRALEISRQQRMKREAETAMRDAGLQIEAEKRAQFEQRYLQERKRIEQELRRELEEKRRREMAPVVERLKKEFAESGASPAPSATVKPAPSSSPAK